MDESSVTCEVCGRANDADARFCSQCGTRLALTCAVCATDNAPDSRFCRQCGTALVAGATPVAAEAPDAEITRYVPEELLRRIRAARAGGVMRGERRTVTMLFADIEGSTAAAERLDPEDWAEIINGAFAHLIAPVYRYEGTLARLQGDAILAFFGAPIAHEDDPVRAVRAGLEIVESLRGYQADVERRTGVPIAVRVGINTGLVVVGEVGSDLRVEYTALGDAINVAARMEQTAEPGTVRITQHTAELIGDLFDVTPIGPVDVKGKAEPVSAFAVRGPRLVADEPDDATEMVGRSDELAALRTIVERLRDGLGGICSVVGEAGIGKSRLLSALRSGAVARDAAATAQDDGALGWLEAHSRSFETSVPYATIADLLRRWWNVTDPTTTFEVATEAVARAVPDADSDVAAFLTNLMGAPLPPSGTALVDALETPALHRRTTDAVTAYLQGEAWHRPVLLVFDDLHWSDALSLALVERLMDLADRVPLGLVLALRPQHDDASWRLLETAGRAFAHRYTALMLTALPDDATRALLEQLAGDGVLDDETRQRILDRADGNPLFVEQLVRSLSRSTTTGAVGIDRIDVPASLTGLLTARLDQLKDRGRLVAQMASIIGAEFEPAALAALLDDPGDLESEILGLVREGIFVERRRNPTPVYAFRHALIQDAAYTTTLLRSRRELHGRLAEHLESAQPAAVQSIAAHFLEAGLGARAFPYLVEAGERAKRAMALADAIELFTRALDEAPPDAPTELVVRAHDGLGEAYGLIPDLPSATSTYQRLLDYGRNCAAPSIQVTALNRLGLATATHAGDLVRADQYLKEAFRIADATGDDEGLAEYHLTACMVAVMEGQLDRALAHDDSTAALGAQQGSDHIRMLGLQRKAMNLLNTTRYQEAAEAVEEAIALAEQTGAQEPLALLRATAGVEFALRAGDLRGALRAVEEQLPVLERFASMHDGHMHAVAADLLLRLGDVEAAVAHASRARRNAVAMGASFGDGAACAMLARGYALCGLEGDHDAMRALALESMRHPMGRFLSSTVWSHLGWAGVALGQPEQAASDFAAGLNTSSATSFLERPSLLLGAAFSAIALDDPVTAQHQLADVEAYTAEREMQAYTAHLALAGGRIAVLEQRFADAGDALARALTAAVQSEQPLVAHEVVVAQCDLAAATGDPDTLEHLLARADGIAQDIAARIADEQLRAAFLRRCAALLDAHRPVTS